MDALEGALERKLSGIQINAEDADALRKGAIAQGDRRSRTGRKIVMLATRIAVLQLAFLTTAAKR